MVRTSGRIFRNATISAAQVAFSAIVLFALYRYLLLTIGASAVGVWSLVLATTSASRISDLGLSASVVRFVAKYRAREESAAVNEVIQTAAISVGLLLGCLLVVGWPGIAWAIRKIVPARQTGAALQLLPYALVSLWFVAVTSVVQSGLEGVQRYDLKNGALFLFNVAYLGLVFLLIPRFGLMGLAYAQLVQSGGLLAVNWALLRLECDSLPMLPYRWSRPRFEEMLRYGLNFQAASLAGVLFDFTTKGLLSRFSGLSSVAYYDMASRMVTQVRSLIVSATQVTIPFFASLNETASSQLLRAYRRTYELLSFLGLLTFGSLFAVIPVISVLWVGEARGRFSLYAALLTIGLGANLLNVPAFFANVATGQLRWNTIGQFSIGLINLALGFLLGVRFDGVGVVVAWTVALILGSSVIVISYHRRHHLPLSLLAPKEHRFLALGVIAAGLVSLLPVPIILAHPLTQPAFWLLPVSTVLILLWPFCSHPLTKQLLTKFVPAFKRHGANKNELFVP